MAKRNNALIFKVVCWVVGITFTAGGIYAAVHYRLNNVEHDVVWVEEDIKVLDARMDDVEDIAIIIQNDLTYLREDMAEQKSLSREILREIKK